MTAPTRAVPDAAPTVGYGDAGAAAHPPKRKSDTRADIQALRALAVALVVIYHLRSSLLPGGYIGVDVFFVISGFLITSHLRRSQSSTVGSFLGGFYARRIRRLLPAALLVLAVIVVVTLLFAPETQWNFTFTNVIASALYYENWSLVAGSFDYLGGHVATLPTQHYWSLSVEEQFYLVWPLVLVGATWFGARLRRARMSLYALAAIGILSFIAAIVWTHANQNSAYLSSAARAWEFAAGGLLTFIPSGVIARVPQWLRALAAWAGYAFIAASALLFSAGTAFPAPWGALPVLGTALVIAASQPAGWLSPQPFARVRPVQFVGDISYSIYLWHWPLIVLLPVVLPLPTRGSLAHAVFYLLVLVLTVLLAWASRRYVERPFVRGFRGHPAATWRTITAAAIAMGVIVAASAPPIIDVRQQLASDRQQLTASVQAAGPCFGAGTLLDSSCSATATSGRYVPSALLAIKDVTDESCQQAPGREAVITCSFGDPNGIPVAAIGDSHVTQWLPALSAAAAKYGWRVTTYLRSGCPLLAGDAAGAECAAWGADVLARVSTEHYKYAFVSARNSFIGEAQAGAGEAAQLDSAWTRLQSDGASVVAIADTPNPASSGVGDVPSCMLAHKAASACAFTKTRSLSTLDPVLLAAKENAHVHVIDLNQDICPGAECAVVIGGVLVYQDDSHLTGTYVKTLVPAFEDALARVGLPTAG